MLKNKALSNNLIKKLYTFFVNKMQSKKFSIDEVRWGYTDAFFSIRNESLEITSHNMNQIRALVTDYGGKFINIRQPLPCLLENYTANSDFFRLCQLHKGLEPSLRHFYSLLDQLDINNTLVKYSNFQSDDFVDHCHLNDKGQHLLAQNIFNDLQNSYF